MATAPRSLDVQALMDAWASNDVRGILGHYRDDVVFHHGALELHGKEDLRAFLGDLLTALGEWKIEPKLVVQKEGGSIAALLRIKGTFKDDVKMGGETFPSRGKRFDLDLADFATVDAEGKIQTEWQLHDSFVLLAQMGLTTTQLQGLASRAAEAFPPQG